MPIKLMQFNIENGGMSVNFDNVIKIIKKANPDIIAIEEPWGNIPLIAKKLGWKYYNLQSHVISQYPIIDSHSKGLFVYIEVEPSKVIAVCNVHLPSDPYGPEALSRGEPHEEVKKLEK